MIKQYGQGQQPQGGQEQPAGGGQIEVPRIQPEQPKAEEKGRGMKQLFLTLLFLTIGLLIILMVGDYVLINFLPTIGTDSTGLSESLRGTGLMIITALGGLTALVFVGWLVARR